MFVYINSDAMLICFVLNLTLSNTTLLSTITVSVGFIYIPLLLTIIQLVLSLNTVSFALSIYP